MKRRLLVILVVALAATAVLLPIFILGFPRGDDAVKHHRWATQFISALKQGVIYPRWLAEANRGYGSPAMIYYAPLPFYVVAAFSLVARDTLQAIAFSCWLATFLAGLAMYAFSRTVASARVSLAVSVIYMTAPYHLLDLYQVNALSEYWCFVWIPLVLYSIHRVVVCNDLSSLICLSASYGAMLLTHVPVPFAATLLLVIYVPVMTRDWRKIVKVTFGLALGVGLSAVFTLPVLFERKYVNIDQVLRIAYRDYFLLRRPLGVFVSGFLSPGPIDETYLREADMAAAGLALILAACCIVFWNRDRGAQEKHTVWLRRALLSLAAVSLLITTKLSLPLWSSVAQLKYVQVPGRFLTIADPAICVLVTIAIGIAARSTRRLMLATVFIALGLLNLMTSVTIVSRARYDPERIQAKVSGLEVDEYSPKWWDGVCRPEFEQSAILVTSGDAITRTLSDKGASQAYEISANSELVVKLRSLFFPGWVARVDGSRTEIRPSTEGNIELTVDPGVHVLSIRFEDTWPRTMGKIVSAMSLLVWLGLISASRRRRKNADLAPSDRP